MVLPFNGAGENDNESAIIKRKSQLRRIAAGLVGGVE